MDQQQALDIVRSLANGLDPDSGNAFPQDSAFQRPSVIRALCVASDALEKIERYDRRRATMLKKSGSPWTEDEDRKLLAAFDSGRALHELADTHTRTMAAIRARLFKYGRINV